MTPRDQGDRDTAATDTEREVAASAEPTAARQPQGEPRSVSAAATPTEAMAV